LQRPRLKGKACGLIRAIDVRVKSLKAEIVRFAHDPAETKAQNAEIRNNIALEAKLVELKERAQLELELWEQDHTSRANEQLVKRPEEIENQLRALFVSPRLPRTPRRASVSASLETD
jgi:hypothetical protein